MDYSIESPEAEKIYAEMYTELSRYEHNSYLNVFLFNYAAIEDDRLAFNFHGNKVTRIKFVFNEVLKVMVFAKTLFFRVLIEKNILLEIDINDNDFLNELQEHAILLHYLIEYLTYQYWEDKENEKD